MDRKHIENVKLVSRDDMLKHCGLDGQAQNLRDAYFLEDQKWRAENRKFRLECERANKMISIIATVSIAATLFGTVTVAKAKFNDMMAEEEAMSQTVYNTDDEDYFDETRPYAPENLVFDEIVSDIDGIKYRVVVNKQDDCSFVDMNYETPFYNLDGVNARDVAERLGFDFNSISNGKSR